MMPPGAELWCQTPLDICASHEDNDFYLSAPDAVRSRLLTSTVLLQRPENKKKEVPNRSTAGQKPDAKAKGGDDDDDDVQQSGEQLDIADGDEKVEDSY